MICFSGDVSAMCMTVLCAGAGAYLGKMMLMVFIMMI